MLRNCLALTGLALAVATTQAQAQKPGVELGIHFGGFSMQNPEDDDNNTTRFGLGNTDVSAAFYLTEMIALEPTLTMSFAKPEGGGDATSATGFKVAVPIYLKRGWGKGGGLFLAPHLGIDRKDPGAGDAVGQNHLGISVGTKLRLSDQIWWRAQAGFDMAMKNEDDALPKTTTIGASFGLSVYLR